MWYKPRVSKEIRNSSFTCVISIAEPFVWNSRSSEERAGERKGLTDEVEYHAGCPYSACQRYNSLVLVPNRNSSGINGHSIPENCRYVETVVEDIRANCNQKR